MLCSSTRICTLTQQTRGCGKQQCSQVPGCLPVPAKHPVHTISTMLPSHQHPSLVLCQGASLLLQQHPGKPAPPAASSSSNGVCNTPAHNHHVHVPTSRQRTHHVLSGLAVHQHTQDVHLVSAAHQHTGCMHAGERKQTSTPTGIHITAHTVRMPLRAAHQHTQDVHLPTRSTPAKARAACS
jgi:hypothetical protein